MAIEGKQPTDLGGLKSVCFNSHRVPHRELFWPHLYVPVFFYLASLVLIQFAPLYNKYIETLDLDRSFLTIYIGQRTEVAPHT